MILEEDPDLRAAAADFIDVAYIQGVLEESFQDQASRKYSFLESSSCEILMLRSISCAERSQTKVSNKDEFNLMGLIEMVSAIIGPDIDDSAAYFIVEAMVTHLPFLQDWSLICGILMKDEAPGDEGLKDEDKPLLAQFLVGALRLASEHPAEARTKGKGKKVRKQSRRDHSFILYLHWRTLWLSLGTCFF